MNHNLPLPNMAGEVLNTKIIHDQVESGEDSDAKPSRRSGRRKIKIEYIEDKNRRHITFSKRKAGIMKKAYELSTLTGTQVLLLVVSETGLVYTFTTTKLQPIVTKSEGKNLIQACLNSPDSIPTDNEDNARSEIETKNTLKEKKESTAVTPSNYSNSPAQYPSIPTPTPSTGTTPAMMPPITPYSHPSYYPSQSPQSSYYYNNNNNNTMPYLPTPSQGYWTPLREDKNNRHIKK